MMNAIFLTQGGTLHLFHDLMKALEEPLQLDKVGFYISGSAFFREFVKQKPDIESEKYTLVKEWEIWDKAKSKKPDIAQLRQYEEKLEIPSLWDAIVSDRRLILGKLYSLQQDYKPRFNHEQILSFLQESLLAAEHLFNRVKPDFVISFLCVTLGEYLCYLIAKSRGIPFLNLRPTRIKNYMTFGESVYEPSEFIRSAFVKNMSERTEDQWIKEARTHLHFVQTQHGRYEGTLPTSRKPSHRLIKKDKRPFYRKLGGIFKSEYLYRHKDSKFDSVVPGGIAPFLYSEIVIPWRAFQINLRLKQKYVTEKDLSSLDYVLFPLHTEPEITLLVYSKPYLNQIEVARNVANNLPVGMSLVVKEHPRSVGKRPMGYYRKLLEIPNVRLADPAMTSRTAILNSKLVSTIAGSIGLEAIFLRKPVMTFGRTPYELLPDSMVRRVDKFDTIGRTIVELLSGYRYDEKAIIGYVAAVMKESVGINFYSGLLGKQGVYVETQLSEETGKRDTQALKKYTIDMLAKHDQIKPKLAEME